MYIVLDIYSSTERGFAPQMGSHLKTSPLHLFIWGTYYSLPFLGFVNRAASSHKQTFPIHFNYCLCELKIFSQLFFLYLFLHSHCSTCFVLLLDFLWHIYRFSYADTCCKYIQVFICRAWSCFATGIPVESITFSVFTVLLIGFYL